MGEAKNKRIFCSTQMSSLSVVTNSLDAGLLQAQMALAQRNDQANHSYVSPSSLNADCIPVVSIHIDGAYKHGNGAIGGIIKEGHNIMISWSLFIGTCPSPNYAEARAALEAILKCRQLNLFTALTYIYRLSSDLDSFCRPKHAYKA